MVKYKCQSIMNQYLITIPKKLGIQIMGSAVDETLYAFMNCTKKSTNDPRSTDLKKS